MLVQIKCSKLIIKVDFECAVSHVCPIKVYLLICEAANSACRLSSHIRGGGERAERETYFQHYSLLICNFPLQIWAMPHYFRCSAQHLDMSEEKIVRGKKRHFSCYRYNAASGEQIHFY